MEYSAALERHDYGRIDKLNTLENLETFWNDVRSFCSRITSDHSIRHWERLAEMRYAELYEKAQRFDYMLLDRLRSDCEYYLGNGGRLDKWLWAGSVDAQIEKMKELYNGLYVKPQWLTMERIDDYARRMREEN